MLKILKITGIILLLIMAGILVFIFTNLKNRHPDYQIDINVTQTSRNILEVGFSAIPITPVIPDKWMDANQDAQYNPKDGDTFSDGNGNRNFDAVWLAGFQNKRPANGVHDDLWARTMVIDDGQSRLSITVIDAIGFMHDDIIDIRKSLPANTNLTYSIISSTHTHEAPDLLGLWGKNYFSSGVDPEYLQYVKDQCKISIIEAIDSKRPAWIIFAQDTVGLKDLVFDTRKPLVTDHGLRLIQAIDIESNHTLGTLIAWSNHPETLWNKNLLITSDFPHYVREGIENGIFKEDSLLKNGLGGIAIYINGAIGGLMTTPPEFDITDPVTQHVYSNPSFEKAKAQGTQIALASLNALQNSTDTLKSGNLSIIAKNINLPLTNPIFRLGASLGILDRGMNGWMTMRSEISFFTLGPASFITIPGEIYPEIINGGIETPEGQDFNINPVEIPGLRDMMPGKYKFVFGMTNDMIGYIIPKSEWDEKEPYLYGDSESPYGEINSLGFETGPVIHQEISKLLNP